MTRQLGFWGVHTHLKEVSTDGDPLETLAGAADFERIRPTLDAAAALASGLEGGRLSLGAVPVFRMLVLHGVGGLTLAATKAVVRDRLDWMPFCSLELHE